MNQKLPEELLKQRPALAEETDTQHPSNGAVLGDPPRKYTRAVHDRICEEIRKGNRPVVAASLAGITSATFYEWCRRGKAGDPHLYEFAEDVEIAYNQAEGDAVAVVKEAYSNPDPSLRDIDAAKWWLERSRADGYSKQVKTQADAQVRDFLIRLEQDLDPPTFQRVLEVYVGMTHSNEVRGTLAAAHAKALPAHVADAEVDEESSEPDNAG